MDKCPKQFALVQYYLKELPEEETLALKEHLQECSACQKILGQIESTAADYNSIREDSFARLKAQIKTMPHSPKVTFLRRLFPKQAKPILIAASIAFLVIIGFLVTGLNHSPDFAVNYKGDLGVKIIVKRGDEQFYVQPGQTLREGDALRFVITCSTPGFLSIFTVSADGSSNFFYPELPPELDRYPLRIDTAGENVLEGSVILDNYTGTETIIIYFSSENFSRIEVYK